MTVKGLSRSKSNTLVAYMFISPALILIGICGLLPAILALVVSFTNLDMSFLTHPFDSKIIEFKNYIEVINDEVFIKSLLNTIFYVVAGVPAVIICALGVALLLSSGSGMIFNIGRAAYYMPVVTNAVAIAIIWTYLFNVNYGPLNSLLGIFGIQPVQWTADIHMAKISMLLMATWSGIGTAMIIFIAAIRDIPKTYFESAEIDGANAWQKLIKIRIPLLYNAFFFVMITSVIGYLNFFNAPFLLTTGTGGPLYSTNSLLLFIYQRGINSQRFGYASAASFILFTIIMTITYLQFRFKKDPIEY